MIKKEVTLSVDDYNFICKNIMELNYNNKKFNKYKLLLSIDELNIVLEKLLKYFIEKGLSDDDEPNNIGLYVEGLIDTFTRGLLPH